MVFPTFFNWSLNFAIRSSLSKPQSAPGLVFVDCIELLHLWLQRLYQMDFSVEHLVMSMCGVVSCVVRRGCLLWPVRLIGKTVSFCPASFCTPRPNLSVTPGISWLPIFAFQSLMMKRASFLVLILEDFVGHHRTVQLQLLQHYWSGHRLGLLRYWMICLGNEHRSFCRYWDCIQVPHFKRGFLHFQNVCQTQAWIISRCVSSSK